MIINDNMRWMTKAIDQANYALKKDEVPIGAVIVKDNKIIGKGYNQVESLKDSTAHAEILAITSASDSLGDWRLNKSSLYVTKEPCLMCWGAIRNSRISNVYFGANDEGVNLEILQSKLEFDMPHLSFVEGGILEYDCKKILQDFFLNKR
ncbi:MAG: tRNA-specific adenosine deaminase [Candidatus Marinimicrobia bacterium]|nr:tRNA-specific adenosine deaminase [Candidatus Neomarinimicrobiota bacterium]